MYNVTKRIPLIEELDTLLPPLVLFEVFRREPYCFFLDSAMGPEKLGRYSFMGSSPFLRLSSKGDIITINRDNHDITVKGNPIDILGKHLEEYRLDNHHHQLPFSGGAFGYFSYDICRVIEKLPEKAINDLNLPECCFGFYDLVLVYDSLVGKTFAVSTGFPEQEEGRRQKKARERLDELKSRLKKQECSVISLGDKDTVHCLSILPLKLKSNFNHASYLKAVARAREYIIAGDIYEVNLSQRFETGINIPPFELYLRLREINPAPFAAYMDCGDVTVVSASPERFLRCCGDMVETRPIKGTRRRGKTPEEDRINADELVNSIKDHAENMMIVDLERNDLGRVCRFGSVNVTEFAVLEKFPTVYHLTSTVVGQLREDKSRIDLLKSTLPGGSITGAPKVRSMEIIDELEPTRRSVYTGNIGYLSFDGNVDLNIVIRTFLIKDSKVYFQVGGAVVYDSDPELEYRETLDKGKALIRALQLISGRR